MRKLFPISLLFILGSQGCVSSVTDHQVADEPARKQTQYALLKPVHLPRGDGPAGCGAQAFAAAAAYVDSDVDAQELCEELPWNTTGATAPQILIAARQRGFKATLRKGDLAVLQKDLQRDCPTLVLFDSRSAVHYPLLGDVRPGGKMYHWAIVTGLSPAQGRILLAAPNDRDDELTQADFESRWSQSDDCLIEINPGKDGVP